MKLLWLFLLPLFSLPDMLFSQETDVGILKSTDYIILPYLASLLLAGASRRANETKWLTRVLTLFLLWALLAIATIPLRYNYPDTYFVRVGIVKAGKFALYAAAGIGTIRVLLDDPSLLPRFRWSLLASLLVASVSVYATSQSLDDLPSSPEEPGFRYEAMNAVSVQISILMAFVLGEWAVRRGTQSWRSIGVIALPVAVLGFFLTGGRGGWVGLLIALAYILLKVGLRPAFAVSGVVVALVGTFAYLQNEGFSHHVDITVNPQLLEQETEFAQATGFDDGNRFNIFLKESVKVMRAPLLGSGLFHRGFRSGLDPNGSHNFFLQMLLETGIVGGFLIGRWFWLMWRVAGQGPTPGESAIGSRAALVAAIAGACTGEYFYGGPPLLAVLAAMAPACLYEMERARQAAFSSAPTSSDAIEALASPAAIR